MGYGNCPKCGNHGLVSMCEKCGDVKCQSCRQKDATGTTVCPNCRGKVKPL